MVFSGPLYARVVEALRDDVQTSERGRTKSFPDDVYSTIAVMKFTYESSREESKREPRTPEDDVPTQLARACVFSASLCELPLPAKQYQAIQKACHLTDQQTPCDLRNLIDWGLQQRGLGEFAKSWATILSRYYALFSRPVRFLPWIMLAVAGAAFVAMALYDLIEVYRAPEPPRSDEIATYQAGFVFLNFVGRLAFVAITGAVACWGLFHALFPKISRRADDEDLSLLDRFADRAVMALGRLGQGIGHKEPKSSEVVADRTRRAVFRILRPTQVILASLLLLIGAWALGSNVGHYSANWVIEGLLKVQAPVWDASKLNPPKQALTLWLFLTATPVETFVGNDGFAPLWDWLAESPKLRTSTNAKQGEIWRDSFSKLISKSNLLLALCAAVPLGLNLLALLRICSRVPLPRGDISSLLAELPAGRNMRLEDLVEDIRQWRPDPPPDLVESVVPVKPLGPPPATERRQSDEVWLVSVHTLSNSPTLLHEDGIERLIRQLGRPVRLMDARTHAGREAITRSQGSIVPADTQPNCIVYFVHAPATPTADIRTFIAALDRQCPASAKIILLADRGLVPVHSRRDRDELWRIAAPSQESTADFGDVHHVLASLDARAAPDEFWNQLAREITQIVSPASSALSGTVRVAKPREERGERLSKAFEIISETLARARAESSSDFSAKLRRLANETRQRVRDCFGKEHSLFDVGAEAAIAFARDGHDYAGDVATKAKTKAQVHGNKLLQVLETWLFRAASGLSAFLLLILFAGLIPLALYVGPMACLAWAMYAATRTARLQFIPNLDDSDSEESPIEERARQLNAFIANAVAVACSCYWQREDDRQQACSTSALRWSHGARCDDLPKEADLRECWRRSFPEQNRS